MDVTLNDKLGPEGRATIMFRGRQVGYYRRATNQVQFAPAHMDAQQRELILGELSELLGNEPSSITNPPPLPPPAEAYEPLNDFDEE